MADMEKVTKKKNPKYSEMVVEAFKKLDSRSGVSRVSIVNYIMANYDFVSKVNANKYVTKALNEGVESGQYIQLRGNGANGSFKLSDQLKKEVRAEKDKAARAEKRAEKAALKGEEDKPAKKEPKKKPAIKSAAANKSKVDIRKSGVTFKKINTKKLQLAAKLVKENKMEKPKKGEKLHVSILIKPKAKKAPKAKKNETAPEGETTEKPVESVADVAKSKASKKKTSPVKAKTSPTKKAKTTESTEKPTQAKKGKNATAEADEPVAESTEKKGSPAKKPTAAKKQPAKKAK